jgi:hypothetical protein
VESDFYQKDCQVVAVKRGGVRDGPFHSLCGVRIAHRDLTVVTGTHWLIAVPVSQVEIVTAGLAGKVGASTTVRTGEVNWLINFYEAAEAELLASQGGFRLRQVAAVAFGFAASKLNKRAQDINGHFLEVMLANGAMDKRKHPH